MLVGKRAGANEKQQGPNALVLNAGNGYWRRRLAGTVAGGIKTCLSRKGEKMKA